MLSLLPLLQPWSALHVPARHWHEPQLPRLPAALPSTFPRPLAAPAALALLLLCLFFESCSAGVNLDHRGLQSIQCIYRIEPWARPSTGPFHDSHLDYKIIIKRVKLRRYFTAGSLHSQRTHVLEHVDLLEKRSAMEKPICLSFVRSPKPLGGQISQRQILCLRLRHLLLQCFSHARHERRMGGEAMKLFFGHFRSFGQDHCALDIVGNMFTRVYAFLACYFFFLTAMEHFIHCPDSSLELRDVDGSACNEKRRGGVNVDGCAGRGVAVRRCTQQKQQKQTLRAWRSPPSASILANRASISGFVADMESEFLMACLNSIFEICPSLLRSHSVMSSPTVIPRFKIAPPNRFNSEESFWMTCIRTRFSSARMSSAAAC